MCVRLILVLVLGRQTVYGQKTVYLCLSTYIVFENTHTHSNVRVTTAASETEGVAAVSWIESWIEYVPGSSERFVANCGVGPSTRGQDHSASLMKPTQDQRR